MEERAEDPFPDEVPVSGNPSGETVRIAYGSGITPVIGSSVCSTCRRYRADDSTECDCLAGKETRTLMKPAQPLPRQERSASHIDEGGCIKDSRREALLATIANWDRDTRSIRWKGRPRKRESHTTGVYGALPCPSLRHTSST